MAIIYPLEGGYPDLLDLRTTLKRIKINAKPEEIYQDFRTLYNWFRIVVHFCHNHGKHRHEHARDILAIAESFIGRKLSEDAFRAAVHLNNLKTHESTFRLEVGKTRFDFLSVKVPDLGRIDEARDLWQ